VCDGVGHNNEEGVSGAFLVVCVTKGAQSYFGPTFFKHAACAFGHAKMKGLKVASQVTELTKGIKKLQAYGATMCE
jgi:hypothetical protein